MEQKKTFRTVLAGFVVVVMVLPLIAAINSLLTQWLNQSEWWKPIQDVIVSWQARMVAVTLTPFGIVSKITSGSVYSSFYMIKDGVAIPVYLSWNCLGWQSVLLLVVSLMAGLKGNFTQTSRIKCILFGLAGTLVINVARMTLIALGIYYVNSLAAQIVHDYLAAFITVVWLIAFWWFSYSYILTNKGTILPK